MNNLTSEISPVFSRRENRTQWLFERFGEVFQTARVLDVGCF